MRLFKRVSFFLFTFINSTLQLFYIIHELLKEIKKKNFRLYHLDAGKTTLTEKPPFGAIQEAGAVKIIK
jgi:hypothetical protein